MRVDGIMLLFDDRITGIINSSIRKPSLSNCLLSDLDFKKRYEEDGYDLVSEDPLIIIEKHSDYNQLYYFLDEHEILDDNISEVKSLLEKYTPLYADYTTKDEFAFQDSIFSKLGFYHYRTYIRKSVVNKDLHIRKMIDTVYAGIDDLEDINKMLSAQFDMMADHIPDENELGRIIEDNQVLKIIINNKIAGVLLFEDVGKRSYARALCVSPEYQNSFVGYSLLSDYVNNHRPEETTLFYLWVDEANTNVKKLHDGFGYRFDGLKNYIFRRV